MRALKSEWVVLAAVGVAGLSVADGLFTAWAWSRGWIAEENSLMAWGLIGGGFVTVKGLQVLLVAGLGWLYEYRPVPVIGWGLLGVAGVYGMVYARVGLQVLGLV